MRPINKPHHSQYLYTASGSVCSFCIIFSYRLRKIKMRPINKPSIQRNYICLCKNAGVDACIDTMRTDEGICPYTSNQNHTFAGKPLMDSGEEWINPFPTTYLKRNEKNESKNKVFKRKSSKA